MNINHKGMPSSKISKIPLQNLNNKKTIELKVDPKLLKEALTFHTIISHSQTSNTVSNSHKLDE